MDGPLLVDANDPKMEDCRRIARALLFACRQVGMAAEGDQGEQALYFAGVCVVNESQMDPIRAMQALGAIMGAAASVCPGPDAAVLIASAMADKYIEDLRQREFLTDAEPQGRA